MCLLISFNVLVFVIYLGIEMLCVIVFKSLLFLFFLRNFWIFLWRKNIVEDDLNKILNLFLWNGCRGFVCKEFCFKNLFMKFEKFLNLLDFLLLFLERVLYVVLIRCVVFVFLSCKNDLLNIGGLFLKKFFFVFVKEML